MKPRIRNLLSTSINILFSLAIVIEVVYILVKIPKDDIAEAFVKYRGITIPIAIILISLIVLMVGLILNSWELYKISDKLAYNSEHDQLTGLPNMTLFEKKLSESIKSDKNFSVLLIDLENFKSINDFNSHEIGDFVLKKVADRLSNIQTMWDSEAFAARHSSDKFIMLITNKQEESETTMVYYIRQALSSPIQIPISDSGKSQTLNQKSINLRTSIGIVNSDMVEDRSSVDEYLSAIDIALNEAKSIGKNKYVFFNIEMKRKIVQKAQTAKIIETACKRDEFSVVYQPQINASDGQLHGYEALIRMKNGKLGPAQFIPIAEEDGHIAKIGRIITEKVIRQIAEWRSHGVPLRRVSINYSFGQLEDKEYVSYLVNLMQSYSIPPDLIGIEITESLFMGNKARALEVFEEFRQSNIKVALDDFGTGYSSLSYLIQLPLETVKIDKSMVDTYLHEDEAGKGGTDFIQNIVNLVHSLGMKITVEGVEYQWQFDKLKALGCDYIQGYFFSKPLSGKEIESFVPKKI